MWGKPLFALNIKLSKQETIVMQSITYSLQESAYFYTFSMNTHRKDKIMNINYKLIGKRIKFYRNQKNMSQMQLAEKVELSVPYISYIETGTKRISLPVLIKIAEALGTTPNNLLTDHITPFAEQLPIELLSIIEDLNSYETQFINDMLKALKLAVRDNLWFTNK